MTESLTERFQDALSAHNATASVVGTDDFGAVLAERLTGPAVGSPLPFDGVSLDDLPVVLDPTPADLEAATFGVTPAELALADYGSVVVRADGHGSEAVSLFPETHVAVVAQSSIEPDARSAFEQLDETAREDRSSAVVETGPSATADMGGLVYGAHGPTDVHVLILCDR